MKIYKYRDLSNPGDDDFERLGAAVHRHLVWCARPDTLNDPQEFVWSCDYTPTDATLDLLTEVLIKARRRMREDAKVIAAIALQSGRLESVAAPVIGGMIEQCCREIGLVCFGTTPDNDVLWQRYGGGGAGLCVEFEVPDDLLGTQLQRVQYLDEKRLHVDQLLRAFTEHGYGQTVYDLALLSKGMYWASEEEVRFVSQQHSILVAIDRSQVSCVFLGDELTADVRETVRRIVFPAPLANRHR